MKLGTVFTVIIETPIMKYIFTLAFIFLSSFGFAQKTVEVPTIAFKVPLGETVQLDNVAFSLTEILEDSRCPSDVTCVWAGRAKVSVDIEINGEAISSKVITFQNSKQHVLLETNTHLYRAVKLSPYPTSATKNTMVYELLISAIPKEIE